MKKYILIHFEIQKKLIVVGLFLLLAGFRGPQANFTGRSLRLLSRPGKISQIPGQPNFDRVPAKMALKIWPQIKQHDHSL